MNNAERFARLFLLGLLLGMPAALISSRWLSRSLNPERVIEIHGRIPESGGWSPDEINARAGEPLHLRLTSDDVLHGFAVGQSGWPEVEVRPGQFSETSLTFDRPGTYTFYCTRWCGPNHWRMRGTIEVSGEGSQQEQPVRPLYLRLGIDIDAPHPAEIIPAKAPSAETGRALNIDLPGDLLDKNFIRSQSPVEYWRLLRASPLTGGLSDDQVWDLVAYAWASATTPGSLEAGRRLYAQNCAACHGESGRGDGVLAPAASSQADQGEGIQLKAPANFNDPATMLGASPALLQGKIVRGGMGTGMPYWGPIFTEEQTWALVDYLWTFQFDP
jgi:mono/diheme cytochrome c family protein/plastocyanin